VSPESRFRAASFTAARTEIYAVIPHTDRVFVRHEPNMPSRGLVSELDIGTFLRRGPLNPEHQALLRLIVTLVHDGNEGSPSN